MSLILSLIFKLKLSLFSKELLLNWSSIFMLL